MYSDADQNAKQSKTLGGLRLLGRNTFSLFYSLGSLQLNRYKSTLPSSYEVLLLLSFIRTTSKAHHFNNGLKATNMSPPVESTIRWFMNHFNNTQL